MTRSAIVEGSEDADENEEKEPKMETEI